LLVFLMIVSRVTVFRDRVMFMG